MSDVLLERLRILTDKLGFRRDWYLILMGAVIGTVTGLGAVVFDRILHYVEHFSLETQGNLSLWLLPLVPIAGAALTGVVVTMFASDARGHGVPQVLLALIKKRGRIPLRVGIVKVIASAFTVGTGGSAGVEGPIVQIGATAGSNFGQRLHVNREQMSTMIGCGAAAGIASIFNAPIAGVFFVLEVLLRDFSMRTFAPVVIASVLSAATTQTVMPMLEPDMQVGMSAAIFAVPGSLDDYVFLARELPAYVLLGLFCGALAVGFARTLHFGEDIFAKIKVHFIVKPMIGAAMLGGLGILFFVLFPSEQTEAPIPAFFGNGYDMIRNLLDRDWYANGQTNMVIVMLIALVGCKIVGTTFTLGSGGSGGIFAPSLFLGAMAGGAYGIGLDRAGLLPANGTPASYALVGMAAVVAAAMHAPLTAILMLFELTREEKVLLPIMLAAVVATVVATLIDRDSIYTSSLRRMGVLMAGSRDATLMRRIPVADVPLTPLTPEPVYPSDPLSKLVTLHAYHSVPDFAVVDPAGTYVGMVTGADMRTALIDREAIPLLLVAELLRTDLPTIAKSEHLDTVMEKFAKHDVSSLVLIDCDAEAEEAHVGRPLGLITRSKLLATYNKAIAES